MKHEIIMACESLKEELEGIEEYHSMKEKSTDTSFHKLVDQIVEAEKNHAIALVNYIKDNM